MCKNAGPTYLLVLDERGCKRGFAIGAFSFFTMLRQQRALSASEEEVVCQGV